jgi:hypothetical protein
MLAAELGKRIDEIEGELDAAKHDLREQKNKALDAKDRENKEASQQGRRDPTVGDGR